MARLSLLLLPVLAEVCDDVDQFTLAVLHTFEHHQCLLLECHPWRLVTHWFQLLKATDGEVYDIAVDKDVVNLVLMSLVDAGEHLVLDPLPHRLLVHHLALGLYPQVLHRVPTGRILIVGWHVCAHLVLPHPHFPRRGVPVRPCVWPGLLQNLLPQPSLLCCCSLLFRLFLPLPSSNVTWKLTLWVDCLYNLFETVHH